MEFPSPAHLYRCPISESDPFVLFPHSFAITSRSQVGIAVKLYGLLYFIRKHKTGKN